MAHNSANLCTRKEYCKYARFCIKVPKEMREKLLKTKKATSAIEDAIFISKGSGRDCEKI
ncbi:MAG: hypothetical protein ACLS95_07325 [Clostridia bacterium]